MLEKIILSFVGVIASGLCGYLLGKFKKRLAQEEGIKALLRENMTQVYYRYKKDKVMPYYEKESWYLQYESYKKLGGNSFIDELKDEIDKFQIGGE